MITDLINFMQATLEALAVFLFQVIYLGVLVFLCVGIVALLCLPLIIAYCKYLDRKEAQAKHRVPSDPANAADADQVKGRAPGLSEHASPFGQTEARAERTLEHPPP